MPCLATASRWGVSPRSEPRKPMRSARVVSRVIRMTLGLAALGLGAVPVWANRQAVRRKMAQRGSREARIKRESLAQWGRVQLAWRWWMPDRAAGDPVRAGIGQKARALAPTGGGRLGGGAAATRPAFRSTAKRRTAANAMGAKRARNGASTR